MAEFSVSAAFPSNQPEQDRAAETLEVASDAMHHLDHLEIESRLYQQMIEHVRTVYPIEGCGLIATVGRRAVKLYPGTNTEQSETRYNMEPSEVMKALDEINQRGWQLGAIYHSHPRTDARPSSSDLDHAYYPEALMVIISLASDPPDTRAFRVDGEVQESRIVISP